MGSGCYDIDGRCVNCKKLHPCDCEVEKPKFLGSRAEGESEISHADREAEWKENHACFLCGEFDCDGSCGDMEVGQGND